MKIKNRIAILYDWFDKWGGVERMLLVFNEIFPYVDFYTSYVNKKKVFWADKFNIKTSFIQNFPGFIKNNRILSIPFYPFVFESFNLINYDLIISITSSFAKGIIVRPETRYICYLLTPTRFLWTHENYYLNISNLKLIKLYKDYLKKWDLIASKKPDEIVSISYNIKNKCKKYYGRDSEVIYPPFDVEYWKKIKIKVKNLRSNLSSKIKNIKSSFFLIVSRLEPYKNIDLAIKTFNKIKLNLVIVGRGSQEKKLKKIANENILFLSDLSDLELGFLYSIAEALIMPQEEDFGYVALESQFFDCPVISYKKGGSLETVIENKTGIFFNNQNENELINAVERFFKIKYNLKNNIKNYKKNIETKFKKEEFVKKFLNILKI